MPSLYLHVPVWQAPRSYEEAYTVDVPPSFDESTILTALSCEVEHYAQHLTPEAPITTLYVGGGRPSLLSSEAARPLLNTLTNKLDASGIEEVTVEVRPADASAAYLNALRRLGVLRLSLGVLSFVPGDLERFDAPHSVEEARQAVQRARAVGFQTFSVDLLFGGADHPLAHWKTSLQRTVELGIPHVTLHEHRPSDETTAEDERAERLSIAMRFLHAKGYEQYELTHFARPRHRSRYQENVYAHGNVLGLGPGAESFWWPNRTENTTAERWSNVRDLEAYVEHLVQGELPIAHRETLDRTALAREYVLLRLRTNEGLDLNVLDAQYGVDLRSRTSPVLHRLAQEGLIHDEPDRVRLTDRGRLLADAITQRLLPFC